MLTKMLVLILFIGLNVASLAFHVPLQHSKRHHPFIAGDGEISESRLQYKDGRDIETEKNVSIVKVDQPVHSSSSFSSRVTKSTPIQNIVTIDNLSDFKGYMNSNQDKILVVRFFASWCQNCKRTEPSFHRFARRNPNISFINIPFTKTNADLHRALNVSAVPYGQIYTSAKLVDEMSLTMKNWSHFEKSVKQYYYATEASSI